MYTITQEMGDVIATDTQTAIAKVEEALLHSVHQLASTISVLKDKALPIGVKKKLYGSLNASAAKIIEAQAQQDEAVRLLHLINKHNATPVKMFGCPGGWPIRHQKDGDAVLASASVA